MQPTYGHNDCPPAAASQFRGSSKTLQDLGQELYASLTLKDPLRPEGESVRQLYLTHGGPAAVLAMEGGKVGGAEVGGRVGGVGGGRQELLREDER